MCRVSCNRQPVSLPRAQPAAQERTLTANVEAARYALFSRILPVLLHGLVGELQAMRFGVSLARLTCEGAESTDRILGSIARIGEQTHAAAARGQAIAEWLRPDTSATTTAHDMVRACLDMVATEWGLRGIEIRTDNGASAQVVWSAMCREMLSAMLVTMGDSLPGPADVTLRLRPRPGSVVVSLCSRAATREGDQLRVSHARALRWSDVTSLAECHGITCVQRGGRMLARIPVP
jgi:hypothetical protein